MYWQESAKEETPAGVDAVIDVSFQIRCANLPVDHAWALSQAILNELPWLSSVSGAGVHTIHVAESGNGWMRPEGAGDLLYLSRRTKLQIRVPADRRQDAESLVGKTLDVAGHPLAIEKSAIRPLAALTTIFSRYVVHEGDTDENAFLGAQARALEAMDVQPRKMLCGIEKLIGTPDGPVRTRSLMIADLKLPESLRIQQRGLGPHRLMGCGLFLPHKDIKELNPQQSG